MDSQLLAIVQGSHNIVSEVGEKWETTVDTSVSDQFCRYQDEAQPELTTWEEVHLFLITTINLLHAHLSASRIQHTKQILFFCIMKIAFI